LDTLSAFNACRKRKCTRILFAGVCDNQGTDQDELNPIEKKIISVIIDTPTLSQKKIADIIGEKAV